jgi:hypothetical protein
VPVSDIQTLAVCSMSIAHDSDLRRTDELYRKPPRQLAGGQGADNDRLAELARLIAQDDPFAQTGKRPQAPQGATDRYADAEHAPNWLVRPRPRHITGHSSKRVVSKSREKPPIGGLNRRALRHLDAKNCQSGSVRPALQLLAVAGCQLDQAFLPSFELLDLLR